MSNCCSTMAQEGRAVSHECPRCGGKGRAVESITVKALLRPAALARLQPDSYRFCPTPTCPMVYFAGEGSSAYQKEDLKVRLGIKEAEDPVPVCYCFGHTRESIEGEIRLTGQS